MERNLALEMVRLTEAAALASARLMGRGDEVEADYAAAEAMHSLFSVIECDGQIVIGEGEEEAIPMLYVGEKLGNGSGPPIELALDALEGATSCATGSSDAISVIAAAEPGGFLRCPPNCHMDKIAVGPEGRGEIDLDKPVEDNLLAVAKAKGVPVSNLTVVVLDRPRNEALIGELRRLGTRVKLISDGDLSAALATTHEPAGVDLLMGIGGAAQGVLAAAALRCIGGEIQGRFRPHNEDEAKQLHDLDIHDFRKKYGTEELAGGNVMFAATGVTTGGYLTGVRFYSGGAMTNSVVVRSETRTLRLLETFHHFEQHPEY